MPRDARADGSEEAEASGLPVSAPRADADGCDLIDRFRLTSLHSEGGLGRVWLARDPSIDREVAIKELLAEQAGEPKARARFLREARITGQLEHPNIVPVYEVGEREDDGRPYYAMRFVRGPTLADAIREDSELHGGSRGWPRGRSRLLRALCSVGNAIEHAHSRGIVHRDLKPENIVLGRHGELILLDWGLAKRTQDRSETERPAAEAVLHRTHIGAVMGTIAYMAPEQADGQEADERTDVYGLGAILFEILTGRAPHEGDDAVAVLRGIVKDDTPRARSIDSSVPAPLDAICRKAMAKDPGDRYANARELVEDLERWLGDEPVSVLPDGLASGVARWVRRHQSWAFAGTLALLVVLVVATLAAIRLGAAAERERESNERSMRSSARLAALAVGREFVLRWNILQNAAADGQLRDWLRQPAGDDADLQRWLDWQFARHQKGTRAVSWIVQDRSGIQRARHPYSDTSVGKSYAFRDYFHGLGRDLPPSAAGDVEPIREVHSSIVFRSQVTKNLMVAFSVPVWGSNEENEVIGVIGMTVELGGLGFRELGLDERRMTVLVDTRADSKGRRGLVLQHAELAKQRLLQSQDADADVPAYYVPEDRVGQFRAWSGSRVDHLRRLDQLPWEEQLTGRDPIEEGGLERDYLDPVAWKAKGRWLAAFEPVLVRENSGEISDTGWVVIVQERDRPD